MFDREKVNLKDDMTTYFILTSSHRGKNNCFNGHNTIVVKTKYS